jgi:hypothetical protein
MMTAQGIRKVQRTREGSARHGVRERVARFNFPRSAGPYVRLHARAFVLWFLLAAAAAAQLVALYALGELIDLCVSLMEVWAELARKHLELTS